MTSTYKQPGKVIDYTATAAIASGDVVAMSNIIGVAIADIAIGETGAVRIEGVFEVPKVTGAVITQGESLTWDVSASKFDDNAATAAAGDITGAAAVAFEAAGNGDTVLLAKLTGVPGTVS